MRNSSLLELRFIGEGKVRRKCNGAKHNTESVGSHLFIFASGRGAFLMQRRSTVKLAGALGRENVGMSNHKTGERPVRRKPEVSSAMAIIGGLGGPKDNPA